MMNRRCCWDVSHLREVWS